ncbi:hypothetical protein C8F04DRAFT_1314813 [Mycena alexandri]|uniref:Uncharacterized protein n=1 Tax=Mycena alexandri TaxID=1745969 RepID=A0AAD6S8T5_9AGAR|nr:hypothetical protein C8F04DRAFT_1314813 [Mycena alexandri]
MYFFVVTQLASLGVTTWVVTNMIAYVKSNQFHQQLIVASAELYWFSSPSLDCVHSAESRMWWDCGSLRYRLNRVWSNNSPAIQLVFEIVVFCTVCWNVLDRPRSVRTDSQEGHITRVLARDGVPYFLIISGRRVANTVIAVVAPISSLFIIVFFIGAGTTVTTSKVIINSRRELAAGERERMAQLDALVVYSAY